MNLISKVNIKEFRSICDSHDALAAFGNFNAFAGLNNSGKSNILRALNAFFTNRTDLNVSLNYKNDYNRFDLGKKMKNKAIEVAVTFTLPNTFRFRSELQLAHDYLGNNFTIRKRWGRDKDLPEYFLNDAVQQAGLEEQDKIKQFLALINFRYIPNRVLPIDIIKSEHQALRDVLVRRLGGKGKESRKAFDTIQEISSGLIENLASRMKHIGIGSNTIRLDTPKDWADMIFAFGYRLGDGKVEIEDIAQGSGIQSLLMLETLYLIDKDYFQKFGWRQASIWAIEEPESSLHRSLEAQVASFLKEISTTSNNRLQIFSTTHSEIILQYADKQFFVEQKNNQTTIDNSKSTREVIQKSVIAGISKYIHPILFYPLETIVLVDGKYDVPFWQKALKLLSSKTKTIVSCLQDMNSEKTGGEDEIFGYLKNNKTVISCRHKEAPIIVVLDWESKKFEQYLKLARGLENRLLIYKWPEEKANPKLTANFRGIERFYSERLIKIADKKNPNKIGKTSAGKFTISKTDYEAIKATLFEEIKQNGIQETDLIFAKDFINQIIEKTEN